MTRFIDISAAFEEGVSPEHIIAEANTTSYTTFFARVLRPVTRVADDRRLTYEVVHSDGKAPSVLVAFLGTAEEERRLCEQVYSLIRHSRGLEVVEDVVLNGHLVFEQKNTNREMYGETTDPRTGT